MKSKILPSVTMVVDWVVFLAAAATVAVISYEGLTQIAYPDALNIPVTLMDMSFLLSVLLHLIHRDKNTLFFYCNIFNLLLIITAYIMLFAGKDFAPWMLLFWDMYLMLFYFMRILYKIWFEKLNIAGR